MGEQTTDQMADSMQSAAATAFATFGDALKGAGAEAYKGWQQATSNASTLATLGGTAAENIRAVQADTTKPEDYRRTESARITGNAEMMMDIAQRALVQSVAGVKANLMEAIRPVPQTDAATRLLIRSELDMVTSSAPPAQPVLKTLLDLVGTGKPEWDAEILSTYGEARLRQAGQGSDLKALHEGASFKLLTQSGGTPKQVAAKRALIVMDQANVEGHVAGFTHASRFRLDGVKPAAVPDTIAPNVMNTVTPKPKR